MKLPTDKIEKELIAIVKGKLKTKIKNVWHDKDNLLKIDLRKAKQDDDCQLLYLTQTKDCNHRIRVGEEYYSLEAYGSGYGHFQWKKLFKICKNHPKPMVLTYFKKYLGL